MDSFEHFLNDTQIPDNKKGVSRKYSLNLRASIAQRNRSSTTNTGTLITMEDTQKIVDVLSRDGLSQATGPGLRRITDECYRISSSIQSSIDAKVEMIKAMKQEAIDLRVKLFSSTVIIADLMERLTKECLKCPEEGEIRKSTKKFNNTFARNLTQLTNEIDELVVKPLDLGTAAVLSRTTTNTRKTMEKSLKSLEESSASRFLQKWSSTKISLYTERSVKINKAKISLIDHFCDLLHAESSLSAVITKSMLELNRCLERYFGSEHADLTTLQETVGQELRIEMERNQRACNEYNEDLRSFQPNFQAVLLRQSDHLDNNGEDVLTKCGTLSKMTSHYLKKWQPKNCSIASGQFTIENSGTTKNSQQTSYPLVSATIKNIDTESKQFTLLFPAEVKRMVFMAESEADMMEWIDVIERSKKNLLNEVLGKCYDRMSVQQHRSDILFNVKKIPGNERCCDCGALDPSWISVNLGILLCIDCCGIHRALGVQLSKIQSLTMDRLKPDEFDIAMNMGNRDFNKIIMANPGSSQRPDHSTKMGYRRSYIQDKYLNKVFVMKASISMDDVFGYIERADMQGVLLAFANGFDFLEVNHNHLNRWNSLMFAVGNIDANLTGVTRFIFYNRAATNRKETQTEQQKKLSYADLSGNTLAHLCCSMDQVWMLEMLIQTGITVSQSNNQSMSPLQIAETLEHNRCVQAIKRLNRRSRAHSHGDKLSLLLSPQQQQQQQQQPSDVEDTKWLSRFHSDRIVAANEGRLALPSNSQRRHASSSS